VNNYDFPSVEPHDAYRGERAFIRSGLNLEAEVIAQLEALDDADPRKVSNYVAGKATQDARIEYTEERLRLLYVGITRAPRRNSSSPGTWVDSRTRPSRPPRRFWRCIRGNRRIRRNRMDSFQPMQPPKNYLIDMDGVLVSGRTIIPGADQFLERLKARGAKYLVLTNNPLYTPGDLVHRLQPRA
jgi:hypothetical protein